VDRITDRLIATALKPLLFLAAIGLWLEDPRWTYDDSGEHWMRLEQGLPPQFAVMVRQIVVDEAETVYAAAGRELFASQDDGETWQRLAGELPTVQALTVV